MALALLFHRFLPYFPPQAALHQLHGLMRWRVLANAHRDETFGLRPSKDHFEGALRHMDSLRARLASPCSCAAELEVVQRDLADLSVYLGLAIQAGVAPAGLIAIPAS